MSAVAITTCDRAGKTYFSLPFGSHYCSLPYVNMLAFIPVLWALIERNLLKCLHQHARFKARLLIRSIQARQSTSVLPIESAPCCVSAAFFAAPCRASFEPFLPVVASSSSFVTKPPARVSSLERDFLSLHSFNGAFL